MIRFHSRRLLSPEGDASSTPSPEPPAPTPPAPQSVPTAPPPPAASTVNAGKKVEADVATELDAKKLQTRIAQLEDERRQLIESQRAAAAAPQPAPAAEKKKSWLEGGSFFD